MSNPAVAKLLAQRQRETVWMCAACGRSNKDRMKVGDESCYLHAVLIWVDSIKRVDGKLHAEAVQESTNV